MNSLARLMLVFAIFGAISGCGGSADRVEITETAERSEFRPEDPVNATSDERFRPGAMAAKSAKAPSEAQFHFDTPEGWTELETTQFRNPNFAIGEDGDMECYVTRLAGDGGGILLNANRWRNQFGLEAYSEEDVAALPSMFIMGSPAKVLNIKGDFKGMGATDAKENYRIIGALIQTPEALVTVKMIGPDEKLRPQLAKFAEFLESLHSGDGHSHDASAAAPADAPVAAAPAAVPAPTEGGIYTWDVPEGWSGSTQGSAMRLVTFAVGDPGKEAECYIVTLGGDGGGQLSNFNRWLGQFGVEPLLETELSLQPPVFMFDTEAPMLIAEGTFAGTNGIAKENYMLLGTSYQQGDETIFVKFVGHKDTVLEDIQKFMRFCASIEVKS